MSTPDLMISVLDCTLRDGGFYTDWDFRPELVKTYLTSMEEAGIDQVEIGYRSLKRDAFYGAYRYTSEQLLEALAEYAEVPLGVMLDAKELIGVEEKIDELFVPADESKVALVRVAVARQHLDTAAKELERLHDLGYKTTINLMAWATIPRDEQARVLEQMAATKADILYVADSFGGMHPEDFSQVAEQLRPISDKPWGVHLHNNLELAFANALEAVRCGARWVDTSVTGMGRGPGNLKTELLLQHLSTRVGVERYSTDPIYELIGRHLRPLKERYHWGPQPAYVLSGHLSVHPTFAQHLLGSGRYSVAEVTSILSTLHRDGTGRSFNWAALDDAVSNRHVKLPGEAASGNPMPADDWSDREVLVVGRGPLCEQHGDAVNEYIGRSNPVVLECNHQSFIRTASDHYCAFIILANARAMVNDAVERGKKAVVGSAGRPMDLGRTGNGSVYWQRYETRKGALEVADGCVIPHDVVSMFCMALALERGAKRISVVGFDGYPRSGDERDLRMQAEMETFFELLSQQFTDVEVSSLLGTNYSIQTKSIYGVLAHDIKA